MPFQSTTLKLEPNAINSINMILPQLITGDDEKLHLLLFYSFSKLMRNKTHNTGSQIHSVELRQLANVSNVDITYKCSQVTSTVLQLVILDLDFS